MKGFFQVIGLFIFVLCIQAAGENEPADKKLWQQAQKIHQQAIVVDAHAHPFISSFKPELWNLGVDSKTSQIDLVKMKKGGVDVAFYALPLHYEKNGDRPAIQLKNSAEKLKTMLKKYSDRAVPVFSVRQLRRAVKSGKRAVVFSIECPDIFADNAAMVKTYKQLGYWSIVIAHSKMDRIADSDQEDPGNKGLSDFGRKVVARMNQQGVLIDITHASDQLQLDIIQASRTPVIASHSCARALNKRIRGIPDPVIKAIAKKGGVVCVTFGSFHVIPGYSKKYQIARKKFKSIENKIKKKYPDNPEKQKQAINAAWEKHCPTAAPLEKLIDHIDYIVKLVGAIHVGLGSDYGGNPISYVNGIKDASNWQLITYHLLKRGYRENDIKNILGGNLLRVLKEVEKVSAH